jgi:hypothetical protein
VRELFFIQNRDNYTRISREIRGSPETGETTQGKKREEHKEQPRKVKKS